MRTSIGSLMMRLGASSRLARRRLSSYATVLVEGNIASGKTACLRSCACHADVEVLEEPVTRWRNCRGHNLLDLMYQDPSRWALTFQTHVQLTCLDSHTRPAVRSAASVGVKRAPSLQTKPIRLMERSIFSARYCFVEALSAIDTPMPAADYAVLSEWFDWIVRNHRLPVTKILYLRTSPEVAYERVRSRGRAEEKHVSLEYVTRLHNLHEAWLMRKEFPLPGPVTVVNANQSPADLAKEYEQVVTDLQALSMERLMKVSM